MFLTIDWWGCRIPAGQGTVLFVCFCLLVCLFFIDSALLQSFSSSVASCKRKSSGWFDMMETLYQCRLVYSYNNFCDTLYSHPNSHLAVHWDLVFVSHQHAISFTPTSREYLSFFPVCSHVAVFVCAPHQALPSCVHLYAEHAGEKNL